MAQLLPFRSPGTIDIDGPPRLVSIDDDAANDVISALSSETARAILSHLYTEPTHASAVADAVGTSLQNARYHLDNLQSAEVIEPVDTWYSARGTEMTVYAPTSEALVVAAGRKDRTSLLKQTITRVLGAIAILGILSAAINRVLTPGGSTTGLESARDSGTMDVAAQPPPQPDPAWVASLTDVASLVTTPGGLFFTGGLLILALITTYWYLTVYRPHPSHP